MTKRTDLIRALMACAATLPLAIASPAVAEEQAPTEVAGPEHAAGKPKNPAPLRPDRNLRARNALQPQWGRIRTFWGDNSPFWGRIRTFWGDVSPFEGDLNAFWGTNQTFNAGTTGDTITPLWGRIRTFAGDVGASWGRIRTFWDAADAVPGGTGDYATVATEIGTLVDQSQAFWGAAYEAKTGLTFQRGFTDRMLRRYGIDLNDPTSLASLDQSTREHFFLDWNDQLLEYSGADHVDHWMREVNWTPALTQTLGAGADTTIGLLDFKVTGDETRNLVKVDGISEVANGHGSAVVSLIVAAHDGKGVMGIAPKAKVVAYNPFDETYSAGWTDISNGIVSLAKGGASIINASLGVPGWTLNPDWNGVFSDKKVRDAAKDRVIVLAAGNDGITQNFDIRWSHDNPSIIVVGSIDPSGVISEFSNRPGTTCLTDHARCEKDDPLLMDRFIVAPGELILVSDGKGGVTRLSGTSFAAPLVSGTIALIHDRWPWLATKPKDTTGIILKSARDLGDPGVDPVYGVGALDVTAALSPLSWNALTFKQPDLKGNLKDVSIQALRDTSAAVRATWEAKSAYIAAFENTGASYRDFQIPLSSKLANQTVPVGSSQEQFMGYLTSRFTEWLGPPKRFAGSLGGLSFGNVDASATTVPALGGGTMTLTMAPRGLRYGFRNSDVPFQSGVRLVSADQRLSIEAGNGDAAAIVGGQAGFVAASDYDFQSGGANPFVGLASGGAYARVELALTPTLSVASATTQRTLRRDLDSLDFETRRALAGFGAYGANAATMAVRYQPVKAVATSLTYTVLNENSALLGMQSRSESDLPEGSTTDAMTLGGDLSLAPGLMVSGSATMGRTRQGDLSRSALAVGAGGLVSSAFQVGIAKEGLFDRNDRVRVTFAQPMHIERGRIDVSGVGVVDRLTGELGTVVQNVALVGAERRYVAELVYGRDLMDGTAQLSLFGRANLMNADSSDAPAMTLGTAFRLAF